MTRVRLGRRQLLGSRPAFTLIEILVTIGIIGVLVAVTALAVVRVVGGQKGSNTRSTMATIQKVLATHWATVVDDAKQEIKDGILDSSVNNLPTPNQVINSAFGPDNSAGARNRVIFIKARLIEAFPTSYLELMQPYPYQPPIIPPVKHKYTDTYKKALGGKSSDNRLGLTE